VRLRWLVVLLLVLAGLGGLFFAERMNEQQATPHPVALVHLDPDKVTRVVIEGSKGRTVLEKGPDQWRLTEPVDYPAEPELVKSTLSLLAGLMSDGVISTNPAKADLFEVDDAHGLKVALYDSAEAADPRVRLVVGKLAPGFTHTYVKVGDGPEVHQVPGALRFQLERDATQWRDKTVLAFDPATIDGVTLGGKATVTVKRAGDAWAWDPATAGKSGPAAAPATEAVERLIKDLSVLRAQGFEDTPPEAPAKPLLTVTLARKDGTSPIDLVVEAEEGTRYRVVAEANPQRFLVPTGPLEPYVKDPAAALAPPPEAAAPEPGAAPAPAPASTSAPAPPPAAAPAPAG
jgi:hypothetical protein